MRIIKLDAIIMSVLMAVILGFSIFATSLSNADAVLPKSKDPIVSTLLTEANDKVEFAATGDGKGEIHTMNEGGTNNVNLTNILSDETVPARSPDGTKPASKFSAKNLEQMTKGSGPDPKPLGGTGPQLEQNHLRIATWNIQLFDTMGCIFQAGDPFSGDCQAEKRTNQVVDKILANEQAGIHYDFIAFNEVWNEDSKEILVDKLETTFPYYVSYIGSGDLYDLEDSGLMLFSKLPFKALPYHPYYTDANGDPLYDAVGDMLYKYGADVEGSAGVGFNTVAFTEFDECESPDCLASKGAALVQVEKGSRTYTVVFTHAQSDYPENGEYYQGIRKKQLDDIKALISETLTGQPSSEVPNAQLLNQDIIVMGDLNIPYADKQSDLSLEPCKFTTGEWNDRFSSLAPFFGNFVRDAWFYTSSCDDLGYGSDFGKGRRLDYILYDDFRNPLSNAGKTANERLCVQHIKMDFFAISDHNGLVADLNTPTPHCSPSEAWEDPHLTSQGPSNSEYASDPWRNWLKADNNNNPLAIEHLGSTQWIKINEKGTYSFATSHKDANGNWVDNDAIDLEVYASSDLSHPLSPYKDEKKESTVCGMGTGNEPGIEGPVPDGSFGIDCRVVKSQTWVITEPPFYVKIFDREDTWTGQYLLLVDKHQCSSPEDVCILFPGDEPYDAQLIDDKPLNAEDKAWFKIIMDRAYSGKPQYLLFYTYKVDTPLWQPPLEMELLDKNLNLIANDSGEEIYNGNLANIIDSEDLKNVDQHDPNKWLVGPNKFFMTVKRPVGSIFTDFRVGWQTDLTFFHGAHGGLGGTDKLGNAITPFQLVVVDETDPEGGSDDVKLCFESPDNVIPGEIGFIPEWCPFDDEAFDEGHGEGFDHLLGPIAFVEKLEVMFCDVDTLEDDCEVWSILPLQSEIKSEWGKVLVATFDGGEWRMHYNRSHSMMTKN
jgi:hypothetical protein